MALVDDLLKERTARDKSKVTVRKMMTISNKIVINNNDELKRILRAKGVRPPTGNISTVDDKIRLLIIRKGKPVLENV